MWKIVIIFKFVNIIIENNCIKNLYIEVGMGFVMFIGVF